jgi:integrase
MPKQTHLMKRNGVYYCRVVVPKHLHPFTKRREVWKSLGCRSYSEAVRYAKIKVEQIMIQLEESHGILRLNQQAIDNLANQHLVCLLSSDESRRDILHQGSESSHELSGNLETVLERVQSPDWEHRQNYTEEGFSRLIDTLSAGLATANHSGDVELSFKRYQENNQEKLGKASNALRLGDWKAALQTAQQYLKERLGTEIDVSRSVNQHSVRQLCNALLLQEVKALEIIMKRDSGDWSDGLSSSFRELPSPSLPQPSAMDSPTIQQLIDQYLASTQYQSKSDRVKEKAAPHIMGVPEIIDCSIPVSQFRGDRISEFLDGLHYLPVNAKKKFPNLTLRQAIEEAKHDKAIERLSYDTAKGYLKFLSNIFEWARKLEKIEKNPLSGHDVNNSNKKKRDTKPMPLEAVNLLFSTQEMQKNLKARKNEHKFWIPLVGLFTGARLGEIVQLTVNDVQQERGVYYFNITNEPDPTHEAELARSVKTEGSKRKMPIHETLIEIGFLDYYQRLVDAGVASSLFPTCTLGKKTISDPFSKQFNTILNRLKVKERDIVFHSFRHLFRDLIREYDADLPAIAALGWTDNTGKIWPEIKNWAEN